MLLDLWIAQILIFWVFIIAQLKIIPDFPHDFFFIIYIIWKYVVYKYKFRGIFQISFCYWSLFLI